MDFKVITEQSEYLRLINDDFCARLRNSELVILGSNKICSTIEDWNVKVEDIDEKNIIARVELFYVDNRFKSSQLMLIGRALNYKLLAGLIRFEYDRDKYYVVHNPKYILISKNRNFSFNVDVDMDDIFK